MADNELHDIFISNIDFTTRDVLALKIQLEEELQKQCDRFNLGTIHRLDMPRHLSLNAAYAQAFLIMVNRSQHREVAQALNGTTFGRLKLTVRMADRPSRRTHVQSNNSLQETNESGKIDELIGQIKGMIENNNEKNRNIEAREQYLNEVETKLQLRQMILQEKEKMVIEREEEVVKAQTSMAAEKVKSAQEERQAMSNLAVQQKKLDEREKTLAFKERRNARSLSRVVIKCINQNRTRNRTASRVSKNDRNNNLNKNNNNKQLCRRDQAESNNDDDCILVDNESTVTRKKKN
jgi:hypothetical protein